MASAQHLLSEYLQYDLYHSIGAYTIARDRLGELADRMERLSPIPWTGEAAEHEARARARETRERSKLQYVTRLSHQYNDQLVRQRHFAARSADDGSADGWGRPVPNEFPLTLGRRFSREGGPGVEDARRNPWERPLAWAWVLNFYDAAIAAIDVVEDEERRATLRDTNPEAEQLVEKFASSMTWPRGRPARDSDADPDLQARRRRLRRARFEARSEFALARLPGIPRETPHRSNDATEFIPRLATDNLGSDHASSVPLFVISALTEAHLTHHAVEAWQSMSLGAHAQYAAPHLVAHPTEPAAAGRPRWEPKDWLYKELDRSIALDTFAYCVSRCAPWMFAADDAECKRVFEGVPNVWTNAVPARCMWIAAQVGLLALHRRAYSYAMKGDHIKAYNDYYKLQRHVRNARRNVDMAPLHIAGAHEFLTCLEARANQNIGELYRAEHAQRPALKRFRTALECLRRIEDVGEMGAVLTNSRWRVDLLTSRGKASYEMGRHKEALRWHLEGWRAFLLLIAADTNTEASTEKVTDAIAWLDEVKLEPELRKDELQEYLRPVVDQLDHIEVEERYGGLAAEILLRLGHVLLVLRLGLVADPPDLGEDPPPAVKVRGVADCRERFVETLMLPCLQKAAQCDPHSTLVASDLLKARLRLIKWLRGEEQGVEHACEQELGLQDPELPKFAKLADQWPRGGGDYRSLARVAEYLTLLSLHPGVAPKIEDGEDEANLARGFLLSVFMHTDSIDVRKAQMHRYLMRGRAPADPPNDVPRGVTVGRRIGQEVDSPKKAGKPVGPAIEFVCMRRYSSAFPLLPRPSAFRAHGGGYFVRLHPSWPARGRQGEAAGTRAERTGSGEEHSQQELSPEPKRPRPIGIVVDPGPDFVENLYRTHFSLSDIDMIIVTHDHVDHLNSLEPLLSLMHYRDGLLRDQKEQPAPPLYVYGNRSIIDRYKEVAVLSKSGEEQRFKPVEHANDDYHLRKIAGFEGFRIGTMSSQDVDGKGHLDLSMQPSFGVCFYYGESQNGASQRGESQLSLAITSDTPAPPDEVGSAQYKSWLHAWQRALEADVLVAHISTVPLTELRQMARIGARSPAPSEFADVDRRIDEVSNAVRRIREPLQSKLESLDTTIDEARRSAAARGVAAETLPEHQEAVRKRDELVRSAERVRALEKGIAQLTSRLHKFDAGTDAGARRRLCEGEALESIRKQLEEIDRQLRGRIEFSMWLRSREKEGNAELVGPVPVDLRAQWLPPQEHPYLKGTLAWARAYRHARQAVPLKPATGLPDGLFVLGELSEELGTARGKIAEQINKTLFKGVKGERRSFSALTSDVGLCIFVVPAAECEGDGHDERASEERAPSPALGGELSAGEEAGTAGWVSAVGEAATAGRAANADRAAPVRGTARILCTTCELDTDRVPDERYHSADCIREVCVKGENEGIFYNCHHHDPGAEGLFLEQLERFDVFGR